MWESFLLISKSGTAQGNGLIARYAKNIYRKK
jgi:hypothetical protein